MSKSSPSRHSLNDNRPSAPVAVPTGRKATARQALQQAIYLARKLNRELTGGGSAKGSDRAVKDTCSA